MNSIGIRRAGYRRAVLAGTGRQGALAKLASRASRGIPPSAMRQRHFGLGARSDQRTKFTADPADHRARPRIYDESPEPGCTSFQVSPHWYRLAGHFGSRSALARRSSVASQHARCRCDRPVGVLRQGLAGVALSCQSNVNWPRSSGPLISVTVKPIGRRHRRSRQIFASGVSRRCVLETRLAFRRDRHLAPRHLRQTFRVRHRWVTFPDGEYRYEARLGNRFRGSRESSNLFPATLSRSVRKRTLDRCIIPKFTVSWVTHCIPGRTTPRACNSAVRTQSRIMCIAMSSPLVALAASSAGSSFRASDQMAFALRAPNVLYGGAHGLSSIVSPETGLAIGVRCFQAESRSGSPRAYASDRYSLVL